MQAISLNRPLLGTFYFAAVYGWPRTDLELSVAHRAVSAKPAARQITVPMN